VLRFLGRRLAASVLTLLIFATFVFFLASALMPGDFTNNFMPGLPNREALREELGLDRPLVVQWARFMGSLVTGNFGQSLSGVSIGEAMWALLPWTLLIFTVAVGIAFVVGITFGRVAGWSRLSWLKGGIRFTAVTTHSLFPPFLTFALTWAFVQLFGLGVWSNLQNLDVAQQAAVRFPRSAITVPNYGALPWLLIIWFLASGVLVAFLAYAVRRLARRRLPPLLTVAGYLASLWWGWALLGIRDEALDVLLWLSLPIVAVAILAFGEIVLVIDASMDGAREEDYVRTARAKGLREHDVRNRHAARLALLPAMSKFVVSLPFVLSGLVIVEYAFTVPSHYNASLFFPGISRALFGALEARDFPLVVGGLLMIGLLSVVARLLIDLIHARLDPRLLVGGDTSSVEL
jgi:ABC-type dipeptide/oligopeptide/nickel transport system permease component